MSLFTVDWKQMRDADSPMPPDVWFVVKDGKITKKFPGHRSLLAICSDVFKSQFQGPMKDDKKEIKIKDATIVAFTSFMEFFYTKTDDYKVSVIDCQSFGELYDIVYLAEKYHVRDLSNMISQKEIANSKEEIMAAARVAKEYLQLFPDVSKILLERCGRLIASHIEDFESLQKFQANFDGPDFELFGMMVSMVKKEDILHQRCSHGYDPVQGLRGEECKKRAVRCLDHQQCLRGDQCQKLADRCKDHQQCDGYYINQGRGTFFNCKGRAVIAKCKLHK